MFGVSVGVEGVGSFGSLLLVGGGKLSSGGPRWHGRWQPGGAPTPPPPAQGGAPQLRRSKGELPPERDPSERNSLALDRAVTRGAPHAAAATHQGACTEGYGSAGSPLRYCVMTPTYAGPPVRGSPPKPQCMCMPVAPARANSRAESAVHSAAPNTSERPSFPPSVAELVSVMRSPRPRSFTAFCGSGGRAGARAARFFEQAPGASWLAWASPQGQP